MNYFGIMHVYRFEGNRIAEEWFIHFNFNSTYSGGEDCTQHDEDYWEAFWSLPNVSNKKLCDGHFCSPSAWNYIRPTDQVNTENLHLGKWMNRSPYYYHGRWQQHRKGT